MTEVNCPAIFSKDLKKIWEDCIWCKKEIKEFTKTVLYGNQFDIQQNADDYYKLTSGDKINFVQYFIQRYRVSGAIAREQMGNCLGEYQYQVQIQYYLEDICTTGCKATSDEKIQHFFEVLALLVHRELGCDWKGNMLITGNRNAFPAIRFGGEVDGRPVFIGQQDYLAETRGLLTLI